MTKMKKYLSASCLLLILFTSISFAATIPATIVENFVQAVASKDKNKITLAFNELLANVEAQKLLQKNWPNHFTLFNYYKLSEQSKDAKEGLGSAASGTTIDPSVTPPNTIKGLPSNKDYTNVKPTPNRIAVRE